MKKRDSNLEKLFTEEASKLVRKLKRQVGDSPLTVECGDLSLIVTSVSPLREYKDRLIFKSLTSVRYRDAVSLVMSRLPSDDYYPENYKYLVEFVRYPRIYKFTITSSLLLLLVSLFIMGFFVLSTFSHADKLYILCNLVCGMLSFSLLSRR